jgi:hypothetical protein
MYVVTVLFLIGVVEGCSGIDDKKGDMTVIEQEVMSLMKKLDTLDERSRMKLLSQADEQRNELLGVLLKHLGTSPSKNVQAAAIYLIGRHHLSDGVAELIRCIDFDPGREPQPGPEPLWEQYPAMEALITIGWPSVPAVIELLTTEEDNLRRDLAVKVIRYATNSEVAKFILERAHKIESDPNRKGNLQDALMCLNKLPR